MSVYYVFGAAVLIKILDCALLIQKVIPIPLQVACHLYSLLFNNEYNRLLFRFLNIKIGRLVKIACGLPRILDNLVWLASEKK